MAVDNHKIQPQAQPDDMNFRENQDLWELVEHIAEILAIEYIDRMTQQQQNNEMG
jgi:hypothetical protein